jgi:hypothetical protein
VKTHEQENIYQAFFGDDGDPDHLAAAGGHAR